MVKRVSIKLKPEEILPSNLFGYEKSQMKLKIYQHQQLQEKSSQTYKSY